MKKILLLLVVPFVFLSVLSAQISQAEADEIVLERMSREIPPYTIYSRNYTIGDDLQEPSDYIIIYGEKEEEVIEFDFSYWVYYIRYSVPSDKNLASSRYRYMVVNASNGNLLEINSKHLALPVVPSRLHYYWTLVRGAITLKDTYWKLAGVVDMQTGDTTAIVEPKVCRSCYTLMFDSDTEAIGESVMNEVLVDLSVPSFVLRSAPAKAGDWFEFQQALWLATVTSFSCKGNELKFFLKKDGREYYLLYIRV